MIRWRWHQVESPIPEISLPDDCVPSSVVPGLGIGGFLISYWQPVTAEYEDES
jgi:hypothetical protein